LKQDETVDPQQTLDNILDLAERLGIEVRRAALGGEGGGLCTLKGRRVLFIDQSADVATQCERCLADLACLPEIDSTFIRPDLREQFDRRRHERD
jgi:hypothetical protein